MIGFTLSLAAARNANGYDISSQHYFLDLSHMTEEIIDPVRHQTLSDGRAKLG
ncbi:hypothetical protein WDW86_14050 [Bdellovibrionota bacterium FG-2]